MIITQYNVKSCSIPLHHLGMKNNPSYKTRLPITLQRELLAVQKHLRQNAFEIFAKNVNLNNLLEQLVVDIAAAVDHSLQGWRHRWD